MLDFTVELRETNALLKRLVDAVERIAGPEDVKEPVPYVPRKTEPHMIGRVSMDPEGPVMKRLQEIEKRL